MNRYTPGKLGAPLAIAGLALGLLIIGLGYNGAAGTTAGAAQFPYLLSGGFLGLAVVVFATGLLINTSAREDRQRLEGVLLEILDAMQNGQSSTTRVPATADGLFAAGTSSYHVPGCRLVDGREETTYVTAAEAQSRDLKPCRICQPAATTNVTVR